jgi:murein DD-endopeptidase MepM/ murein hydrolase activator NlpD
LTSFLFFCILLVPVASILIDPGNQLKVRRLSAPKWLFMAISFFGASLIAALGFCALSSSNLLNRLARLERKNTEIRQKIARLGAEADSLADKLAYVERHDTQLRIQKGMEVLAPDVRELGVGGGSVESPQMAKLKEIKSPQYADVSRISQDIDKLLRKANYQKESFAEVETTLLKDNEMWDHIPSVVPTQGRFSGKFGIRQDPILGIHKMHCGVDITNEIGTPVMATADGVVCFTGWLDGYGNVVKINHGYEIQTVYAHLSDVYVQVGQAVKRYEVVAAVGNTGRTVGPHLHYEVRVAGKAVDPEGYFLDAEENLTQYPMP